jgi:hypothetical protein
LPLRSAAAAARVDGHFPLVPNLGNTLPYPTLPLPLPVHSKPTRRSLGVACEPATASLRGRKGVGNVDAQCCDSFGLLAHA